MKKQKILLGILAALVFSVAVEGVSYFLLNSQQQQVGFLLNFNYHNLVNEIKGFGFDEADPLCGWALSDKEMEKAGYEVQHHCIVLRSAGAFPAKPVKLLITGGGTTEIVFDSTNWPMQLHHLFVTHKVNAVIYVAAVGGYGTGQELLTLLRDGLSLNPDIHISYSGAHDVREDGFISDYEKDFYKSAFRQRVTTFVFPSTVFLIKRWLHTEDTRQVLKRIAPIKPFDFWIQNINTMQAIAHWQGYQFISILQPVLSMGKYNLQKSEDIDPGHYGMDYPKYYPQVKEYIARGDSSLFDFTAIFDTATGQVYTDDCQQANAYQPVAAREIFRLLTQRGYVATAN